MSGDELVQIVRAVAWPTAALIAVVLVVWEIRRGR
jgi:hypothetical protein